VRECLLDTERSSALVTKELKAQIAEIDKKLRVLGVEPDPFDAAAPVKEEDDEDEPAIPATVEIAKPKVGKPMRATVVVQKSK